MDYTFLLLVLIFILPSVYADTCVIPIDSTIIRTDTLFCKGSHILPNGVLIEGNNLFVDCNGATFEGDFLHAGIRVQGKNAQIRNCVLQNYDIGILYQDNSTAQTTNLTLIGVRLPSVIRYETTREEVAILPANESSPVLNVSRDLISKNDIIASPFNPPLIWLPIIKQLPTSIIKSDLELVGVDRDDYEHTRTKIELARTVSLDQNIGRATYTTTVHALKPIRDLVLFESIPKELVQHARDIRTNPRAIVLQEDPLLKFVIGNLKPGDNRTITYIFNQTTLGDINPKSILSSEMQFNPRKNTWLKGLFALFAIVFFAYQLARNVTHAKPRHWLHLLLFACMAFLFFMGDTSIEVTIPTHSAEIVIGLIVFVGIILYGVAAGVCLEQKHLNSQ